MHSHLTHLLDAEPSAGLEVRIDGADGASIPASDLRRLFPGSTLTEARFDRLSAWPRTVVFCGDRIVAVATCQKRESEFHVPDIGIDASCGCGQPEVVDALVDAIELAGLAGGCRRIILVPPKCAAPLLERRGYVPLADRCVGGWMEKRLA